MTQLRSVIRIPKNEDMETVAAQIEAITRGYVIRYSTLGEQALITIGHHDGPMCPECGEKIHDY